MPKTHLPLAATGLLVAGSLIAGAPLAASAHTGQLFTWAYTLLADSVTGGFAHVSQTDGSLTPVGGVTDPDFMASGGEVCDEKAWAIAVETEEVAASVFTWDHSTGAFGPLVELTADAADFEGATSVTIETAYSADTLADCTALAYVEYYVNVEGGGGPALWLSSIDVATGAATPLVQLVTDAEGDDVEYNWHGIATNPLTGVTYLWFELGGEGGDGLPYVVTADLEAGTVGVPVVLGAAAFYQSEAFVTEADFEPSGILWLSLGVYELEQFRLLSFPTGADLAGAGFSEHGAIPYVDEGTITGTVVRSPDVLTYDPEPALAATGSQPIGALLLGGSLMLGGVLVAIYSARRRALA
jgi:hypothetical protein